MGGLGSGYRRPGLVDGTIRLIEKFYLDINLDWTKLDLSLVASHLIHK